jgi:hypothetical protein
VPFQFALIKKSEIRQAKRQGMAEKINCGRHCVVACTILVARLFPS